MDRSGRGTRGEPPARHVSCSARTEISTGRRSARLPPIRFLERTFENDAERAARKRVARRPGLLESPPR
jgi:hypothetical protein